MRPNTRRLNKASKENNENNIKHTVKTGKVAKPVRKVLADKTNSASDDNASIEIATKVSNTLKSKVTPKVKETRPRRDRRLPTRFVENQVLNRLSNSNQKDDIVKPNLNKSDSNSIEIDVKASFATPSKPESSLVANRPRRVCRLPSRFDDHSVSPNRFIPVQPCHASTPKVQNKVTIISKDSNNKTTEQSSKTNKKSNENKLPLAEPCYKKSVKIIVEKSIENTSPDTNNNPKKSKRLQAKKKNPKPVPSNCTDSALDLSTDQSEEHDTQRPKKGIEVDDSYKLPSKKNLKTKKVLTPKINIPKVVSKKHTGPRLIKANTSFKVLEEKKKARKDNKDLDIYEFTFDPDEEPPPQKKKKRTVKKRTVKPKTVVLKSNYDQNVSEAMNSLKAAVNKKTVPKEPLTKSNTQPKPVNGNTNEIELPQSAHSVKKQHIPDNIGQAEKVPDQLATHIEKPIHTPVYNNHISIQVADIAADFESLDHNDDALNYSPVNTPHPLTPNPQVGAKKPIQNDPLNLQELSFFDDQPVASSSMNLSIRHPQASPWRVEFGSLPLRWHANTYVKPNMTPAVESSFINIYDNNKKKHVYTNMLPEPTETLPEIIDKSKNLKQTSIISFIKEVVERSASKKKKSMTPTKENSLFENLPDNTNIHDKTPKKAKKNKSKTPNSSSENIATDSRHPNENNPANKATKENHKDHTYFGFDESETTGDQENVSPLKVPPQVRALRPRSRAVLQEINAMSRPTRATVPGKGKIATSSETVNKVYEELKSAADAPTFPEKEINLETTDVQNVNDPSWSQDLGSDDSQSVHLFEDIEVVHHNKPVRKSYGKAKKVAFRQRSVSHSDSEDSNRSGFEDNLADLSFQVPDIKEKKVRKRKNTKKLMSKKEEKEAEAWAAGFNSMCEDIEDFPLMVE